MIIRGYRTRNKVLGQTQMVCQQCRRNGFHSITRSTRWFTLYFIPIFPYNKKSFASCNLCGFQSRMDNAQADQLFPKVQQPPQNAGQAPVGGQMPQGGYPPQQNYQQQGGYPPQQNYQQQGGYPPQQNYQQQGGYPPQQNYQQQGGYPPQQR